MVDNIILVTHAAAGLSFGLLLALLTARWRLRPLGPPLALAAAATLAWGVVIAAGSLAPYPPLRAIQFAELARNLAWLAFLLALLGFQQGDAQRWLGRRWLPGFTVLAAASLGLVAFAPQLAAALPGALDGRDLVVVLWLALAIAALLLIEQAYRNAVTAERWGIKFLCLGLGLIFVYDLFLYAEALLFRQLNPAFWAARGLVVALAVPPLLVALARNQSWRLDVHLSRHVVFHTVTLMGAGFYLLAMAVIGYYIKYLGGSWGGVLQATFLAASALLLATLLFSGSLRARLRVLLAKHFFSFRYDYREEWLKFTRALARLEGDIPEGVLRTMAPLAGSNGGALVGREPDGALRLLARWQLDDPVPGDLGGLPGWIRRSGWVVDRDEWRRAPDLYQGLQFPAGLAGAGWLWLIVPLFFQDDLEGLLLLRAGDDERRLNWEDRDLLKTAGQQAGALLAQHRANRALVEARQFDAFNRLSAYVIHDLKNILAQQSLMLTNARKHRDNPAFVDDMIATVASSVERMERLMGQMRSGLREAEAAPVELGTLLAAVVERRGARQPAPRLAPPARACTVIGDPERLGTVFGHLVQNAQEATAADGEVQLALDCDGATARVTVRDNGCGMDADFLRDRLFHPFESTKGLTGMGIGAFESREYVRQLGGDITVESEPGAGSTFTVTLPLADAQSCEPGTPAGGRAVADWAAGE
ncbi:MAG: XrtA/PEP-CTERM system histidine kinase PrsK [Pseudohaliea sp.]